VQANESKQNSIALHYIFVLHLKLHFVVHILHLHFVARFN
jgi:hypothetical protein